MWQSHVEIKGYSVVYFDCIAELWEAKGEAHVLRRFIRYSCICQARMSPALNESSVIRRFKHSNTIKKRDEITCLPGLEMVSLLETRLGDVR